MSIDSEQHEVSQPDRWDLPEPRPVRGSKSWLRHCIDADLAMQGIDRWRHRYRLTKAVVHFQMLLRRSEYWSHPSRRGPLARLMSWQLKVRVRRLSDRLGFEIPRGAFGPGLSIAHAGLLTVDGQVRVGARCRVHQGVTIGASGAGSPTLGDDVFIGPNAVLIGPITLGDGAFVYPGAVCVVDVPAGHSAAGVPARVRPHDLEPWRPDV